MRAMSSDSRQFAPATARNSDPILEILRRVLPAHGCILEISSGTGEHATFFAANLPSLTWQPSDPDPASRASVAGWTAAMAVPNVLPPLDIDVRVPLWPVGTADAVVCINMIHIAPWAATPALFAGSRRVLRPGCVLYLYGPFRRGGQHTAPSNEAFDASLRARNPEWGVRNLEDVARVAGEHGFGPPTVDTMPANNLSVIFTVL